MKRLSLLAVFAFICACTSNLSAQSSTLHEFITETGIIHYNDLATDGEFIYGSKFDGGTRGNGYVYRTRTDGSDFQTILDLVDPENGRNPTGGLILHQGYLYGMCAFGGTEDMGVIFKVNTDCTEYTRILNFDNSLGSVPFSNLIVSNDVLYGLASFPAQRDEGPFSK